MPESEKPSPVPAFFHLGGKPAVGLSRLGGYATQPGQLRHGDEPVALLPERLHDATRGLIEKWDDPIVPVEGMLELLQALKAKGYRLYLLSNAATRQPIYWARAEASKLMDGALISAEVKLLKPDPQIYRTFLRKFALRPEECVFIDDTPINVEGALYENMAGIVFNMDVAALAESLHALGVEW